MGNELCSLDAAKYGPFQHTLFCGASVMDFAAELGWNEQTSQLTVNLAHDPCTVEGDVPKTEWIYDTDYTNLVQTNTFGPDRGFIQPGAGTPLFFKFGPYFTFGGLTQSWIKSHGENGNPTYSITLMDPRELLDGVQVIMNGYVGGFYDQVTERRLENIFNVFGYYEQFGFGYSGRSDSGMAWSGTPSIKSALTTLINTYGIWFKDFSFLIDLSELPDMPNYRFSDTNLSLSEIVSRVCADAGMDYYVELQLRGNQRTIAFRTVSRKTVPPLNVISGWVGDGTGTISASFGREMRNETVGAVMTGGPELSMWTTFFNPNDFTYNIWPFWGFNPNNGKVIIGQGFNDQHYFTYNVASLLPCFNTSRTVRRQLPNKPKDKLRKPDISGRLEYEIFSEYVISVAELRCALVDQDTWLTFLAYVNPDVAAALGVTVDNAPINFEALIRGIVAGNNLPPDVWNWKGVKQNLFDDWMTNPYNLKRIELLYNFIRSIATEYYGKKFIVRLPGIRAKYDVELQRYFYSYEIADSGWMDYSDIYGGPLGVSAFGLEVFKEEDGRIKAYCMFPDARILDMGTLDKENIVVEYKGNVPRLYLAVDVVKDMIVLPDGGVAAVITLPSSVNLSGFNTMAVQPPVVFELIIRAIQGFPPIRDFNDRAAINNNIQQYLTKVGISSLQNPLASPAQMPWGVTVPLQSNVSVYGPWGHVPQSVYINGKVDYEQDDGLVPWNYGGKSILTTVANLLTQEKVVPMQEGETGSVDTYGAPTINLGAVLAAGGPNVTGIDVSMGANGVTTHYRMRTYTPSFGLLAKQNAERLRKLGINSRKLRRSLNLNRRQQGPWNPFQTAHGIASASIKQLLDIVGVPRGVFPRTPHPYLVGGVAKNEDGLYISHVSSIAQTEAPSEFQDWKNKAGMSLDGLLRPFKTGGEDGDFPAFKDMEELDEDDHNKIGRISKLPLPPVKDENTDKFSITVKTLNPFLNPTQNDEFPFEGNEKGHEVEFVVQGEELQENQSVSQRYDDDYPEEQVYRGLCLRGPLILGGWGYDLNGKPVPNKTPDNPSDKFEDDWLRKMNLWKVGPVDLRWDEDRGVWTSWPGYPNVHIEFDEHVLPNESGKAIITNPGIKYDEDGHSIDKEITVINKSPGLYVKTQKAIAKYDENAKYYYTLEGGCTLVRGETNGSKVVVYNANPKLEVEFSTFMLPLNTSIPNKTEVVLMWDAIEEKYYVVSAACTSGTKY